jgi:hypothetical protein
MRYGELTFTAQPGFSFIWQTSRATAVSVLSTEFTAMSGPARHGGIAR